MDKKFLRKVSPENAELFKRCIHLAITITDKYADDKAYEAALEGMYVGLNLYAVNNRNTELDLYLVWFIKTSIEFHLGYDNDDTKVWREKYLKS